MSSRTPFAVAGCAVPLLFVSLYGGFGEWSFAVAALSLVALLCLVVWCVLKLRRTAAVAPHWLVMAGLALGVVLHTYEQTLSSAGASGAWLLWALVPYVVCTAASVVPVTRLPVISGVLAALAIDLLVHYQVFVSPGSSTAALALIFAPLWSSLLVVPVAILVSWLVIRARRAHLRHAP
ncbi:MAG: hypothetical protein IPP18_14250 [Rhodocyclaceae bacterium]|nr:hypothetical protein [Rhodocyclaceae bacterium]